MVTMYKVIFCVLLLYITSAAAAIQANETKLYYQDYDTAPLLSGDQTVLYLYIADTTDLENAKKAIFFPKVDKFSRLEIMNSFIDFSSLKGRNTTTTNSTAETPGTTPTSAPSGNNTAPTAQNSTPSSNLIARATSNTTYVWLQLGDKALNLTTMPKRYVRGEFILASFSAIIQLTRGVPTAIVWDDGCNECNTSIGDPDQCLDNSCGITLWECLTCGTCTNQTCNIKVYLGWIGTDSQGRPLTSAGSLPSNFSKFALTPAFRSAAGTIKDRLTDIGDESSENYDPRFDPNVNTPKYTIG